MSQDNEPLEDAMDREGFGGGVVDDEPDEKLPDTYDQLSPEDKDLVADLMAKEQLEEVLSDLQDLNADRSKSKRGRALAITKIQEAVFWLTQD